MIYVFQVQLYSVKQIKTKFLLTSTPTLTGSWRQLCATSDNVTINCDEQKNLTSAAVLLERVSFIGLLHSLDHRLVDAEGDGDAEQSQQQVGGHADDAEGCERQQHQQGQAERHARLLGVSPVNQILSCREKTGLM